jgi:uncharacterized protein (TIGR00730 family)
MARKTQHSRNRPADQQPKADRGSSSAEKGSPQRKKRARRRRAPNGTPADLSPSKKQRASPSYLLAYEDARFLRRDALRPARIQLETWKTDLILRDHGIRSTVPIFGSSRIMEREQARKMLLAAEARLARDPENPALIKEVEIAGRLLTKSRYYDEARRLAALISRRCQANSARDFVIMTGGGPGIMEAANRGAHEVGALSIGLNIRLPFEQEPNPYITPELCFQFRYFAIRKMHFLMRAKALIAFPGGYGTLDEFFDLITLIQTGKARPVPVILYGTEFWGRAVDLDFLRDEGTIAPEDLDLFRTVDTPEAAWSIISEFHGLDKDNC